MSSFAALRMTSRLGDSHTEKKTARTPREGNAGRPTYWLPGVGEFASPFFFRRPSPIVIGGLASEAPASIPRWLAAFWFTSTSAASRLNRGSASYSARRRATATWTGRAIGLVFPNSKTINSRLGDDSIWSDSQTRKRQFSYPQT